MVAAGLFLSVAQLLAANTKTTVSQVTTSVDVTADVDYVVTSKTPFGDEGVVNLVNTDHAVLILQGVKPSAAVALLPHVRINGEQARNNTNCQVKMYNRGCIIMPYASALKPLTVYSEQNFQGTAVSDFGLEHNGGFMNTLSAAKLNNQIRSFKLKRGYMVTFATRAGGRGYSRCYIAANADLEVATMPLALDQTISSYRIFRWYDFSKAGLANDTRKAATDATNVQGCYSFGLGEDRGMDCECIPHHIYEDWPSAAACGQVTYSPHLKTNNEPGNSADDHPQTVDQILANWENLMATGMRLCSPSSHDGSLNHLRAFLDSIDARGWRCDILDMHCYWTEGSFNNLQGWYNSYGRPIWISEWVWGASWNNNGAFASGVTEAQNATAVQSIVNKLNSWNYVERYFYWNSERDPSRIYKDGNLTQAGTWYAQQNPGLGFQGTNHAPKLPAQKAASRFTVAYDKGTQSASLSWYDQNGEWNKDMQVQRSTDGGQTWETIASPAQQEVPATYTYTDPASRDGYRYRIYLKSLLSQDLYSSVQTCVIEDVTSGDAITVGDKRMYVGGNIITNGDFDLGFTGWTNGLGLPISYPNFQVIPVGGPDGGANLLSWSNLGDATAGGLKSEFDVLPNTRYLFVVSIRNLGGIYQSVTLSDGTPELAFQTTKTGDWQLQMGNFDTGSHQKVTVSFRWLGNGQVDKIMLCRLFDDPEQAFQDALAYEQQRMQAAIDYYQDAFPAICAEWKQQADGLTGPAESLVGSLQRCYAEYMDRLAKAPAQAREAAQAEALAALGLPGLDGFTATSLVENPSFTTNSTGWTGKAGTFQGGDQRRNTVCGLTCWNAWWNNVDATSTETMAIKQEVKNLPEGFYYLQCKALTEHYCLSDQHAFITTTDGQTVASPALTYDRFEYPTLGLTEEPWETLRTTPVYVTDGGSLTIGFQGSKQGAIDGAYKSLSGNPDKREGWWCATAFQLYQMPVFRRPAAASPWGTVCLPYDYAPGVGVQLFEVAGLLTEDGQDYICLQPIDHQEAGYSCVYYTTQPYADFIESGEAVKLARSGSNGLFGTFTSSMLFSFLPGSVGTIVFVDGEWKELTEADFVNGMYTLPAREAYLPGRDQLTKLTSWQGVKMSFGHIADAVSSAALPSTPAPAVYDLQGRPASSATRGLRIEKQGTAVRKVLR